MYTRSCVVKRVWNGFLLGQTLPRISVSSAAKGNALLGLPSTVFPRAHSTWSFEGAAGSPTGEWCRLTSTLLSLSTWRALNAITVRRRANTVTRPLPAAMGGGQRGRYVCVRRVRLPPSPVDTPNSRWRLPAVRWQAGCARCASRRLTCGSLPARPPDFVFAFLAKADQPQLALWLLILYTLLPDKLAAVLGLLGWEQSAYDPYWLPDGPLERTLQLIWHWQQSGRWLEGVDLQRGEEGFQGFHGVGPVYYDVSYSHSVVVAVGVSVLLCVAHGIVQVHLSLRMLLWIFLLPLSHVLLDGVFHDVNLLAGNRARTRFSLGLWRTDGGAVFAAILADIALPALAFVYWLQTTALRAPEYAYRFRRATVVFWLLAIGWLDASWYVAPLVSRLTWNSIHLGSKQWPVMVLLLSWDAILLPAAWIDQLRKPLEVTRDPRESFTDAEELL